MNLSFAVMSNVWDRPTESKTFEKESFIKFKMPPDNIQKDSKLVTYKPAQDDERGGWGNKLDFLFSCISLSVGLGNVWRFPYLCYKNGGGKNISKNWYTFYIHFAFLGAFIVTYTIAMIICGIPMFFQEVAIGQYLGSGGMTFVGQLCPILKGVGYAAMTLVFLLDVYYCIIISWTIFYLMSTFSYLPTLPWSGCGNILLKSYCKTNFFCF